VAGREPNQPRLADDHVRWQHETAKVIFSTYPAIIDDEAPPEYPLPTRQVVRTPAPQGTVRRHGLWGWSTATTSSWSFFDAALTLELIARYRPAFLLLVPTMLHRIMRLPKAVRDVDMTSLKIVSHMGAPCPASLKEAWIDWLGADRIYELYGAADSPGYTIIVGTEWLVARRETLTG
jgi:bile acid-coenzyme A ligase